MLAGVINNAGVSTRVPLECCDLESFRNVMDDNLYGVVRVTQGFLPMIRACRGRVLNVGSLLYVWDVLGDL